MNNMARFILALIFLASAPSGFSHLPERKAMPSTPPIALNKKWSGCPAPLRCFYVCLVLNRYGIGLYPFFQSSFGLYTGQAFHRFPIL